MSDAIGSIVGGLIGARQQSKSNRAQRKWEKKLAKESAGWQMRDMIKTGRKFGLHPLASIGANAGTYEPTSIQSENYLGDGIADALGQYEQNQLQQRQEARLEHAQDREDQLISSEIEVNKARSRSIIQGMKMAALGGPHSTNTNIPGQEPGVPVEDLVQKHKVIEELFTDQGKTTQLPVGPDIGEIIGGMLGRFKIGVEEFGRRYRENREFAKEVDAEIKRQRKQRFNTALEKQGY